MKKRNKKARITLLSPEELRARRATIDATQQARAADRALVQAAEGRKVENWGLNGDGGLYDYKRHVGTRMTRDAAGKPRGVWRANPFTVLVTRGTIGRDEGHAGMDWLGIYAAAHRLDGPPEEGRIAPADPDAGWSHEDRHRFYVRLLAAVAERLTAKSRQLAEAFAQALVEEDRPPDWRTLVERELAVADPAKQTVRFQVMCEELIDAIPRARKAVREVYEAA
jgi:hypothetical protein